MPRMMLSLPRCLLFLALIVALFSPDAAAQEVGAEDVDALFAEWDKPGSPGCALAVIRDGEIVYKNGYGMADLEHGVPITPQTVFYSGSVSKQFVAMSIALLAEQGKLSFDDDIRTYLPEIPEYDRTITIRHMVHHTSGLRDYLQLGFLAGRNYLDSMAEEQVIDLIARQEELNFSPGDQYLYSNSGYFLLAEIVKRASGMTLREYADAHILGPLGMNDSHFHDDNTMIVPRRADGYFNQDDGWGVMTMRFALVGSGGLYTTVEDLYRWDQNFYHNTLGAGSRDLIETTLTRGVLTSGDTLSYAFALDVGTYRGVKTVSHGGALGGYRAHLRRFPDQQFSTALLCNFAEATPGTLAARIADLYLADVLEPSEPEAEVASASDERQEVAVDPALYDDYVGRYELVVQPGLVFTITREGDRLMGQATGQPLVELFPESEIRFFLKVVDAQVEFVREASGAVTRMMLYQGGQELEANRLSDIAPDDLAAYAGTYRSDELQATYTIALDEGRLTLRVQGNPPSELSVTEKDKASAEVGTMAFERDAEGMVTGFVLQSGRVRNLRFEKE